MHLTQNLLKTECKKFILMYAWIIYYPQMISNLKESKLYNTYAARDYSVHLVGF